MARHALCIRRINQGLLNWTHSGVDYTLACTAIDVQNTRKTPYDELAQVMTVLKNAKAAVAGGVNLESIPLTKKYGAEIVVAGGALTKAADLRAAVIEMENAIKN